MEATVPALPGQHIEYKYVLMDPSSSAVVQWELGSNRVLEVPHGVDTLVQSDVDFRPTNNTGKELA
ncbi:MAG: carbohydrate-binding module family 20 domain-containing protein [Saprospiraceae bacterium]